MRKTLNTMIRGVNPPACGRDLLVPDLRLCAER